MNCEAPLRIQPLHADGRNVFCSRRCFRSYEGESTPERNVRLALQQLGIAYLQEHTLPGAGRSVDFFLPDRNLVVEVDSTYWHALVRERDSAKTRSLNSYGFSVLRVDSSPFQGGYTGAMSEYVRWLIAQADNGVADGQFPGFAPYELSLAVGEERVFSGRTN